MQAALEPRKRSGVGKKRWHLHQERDQGFERDVGISAKKEKKSGVGKRCKHLSQERAQGFARDVGTCAKKETRGLKEM